jgi:hypothetical protein
MSFYACFDWFKKLRLFSYVRNLKLDVVLKASRAVVIGLFYQNRKEEKSDSLPLKGLRSLIYDTDCVTSRAGIIREWIMPFVSSTLKSFEK